MAMDFSKAAWFLSHDNLPFILDQTTHTKQIHDLFEVRTAYHITVGPLGPGAKTIPAAVAETIQDAAAFLIIHAKSRELRWDPEVLQQLNRIMESPEEELGEIPTKITYRGMDLYGQSCYWTIEAAPHVRRK